MEGISLGRDRVLKVEREYEGSRFEAQRLAAAYEELVPLMRRDLPVRGQSCEVAGHRDRATVGA